MWYESQLRTTVLYRLFCFALLECLCPRPPSLPAVTTFVNYLLLLSGVDVNFNKVLNVYLDRSDLLLASLLLLVPAIGILLEYVNILTLRTSLIFLMPPSLLIAGILIWKSSRSNTAKLAVYGIIGGLLATIAYDLVRYILFTLGIVSQPFRSIELWGSLILETQDLTLSKITGWIFHFWNGCSFGMFFALAFHRPTIIKGVLWGLFLELALVITSPKLLLLTIQGEFLTSSLLGHIAYGLTLAQVVSRTPARDLSNK